MSGYVRHHRYKELFKYPGSAVWWMFVPNPAGGKALRQSSGSHDDVAAHKEYLRRIRRDPLDGSKAEGKQRTLNDALKVRLEWLETNRKNNDPTRKKLAEATIKFYRQKSGTLVRVLGADRQLSSITPETIREYITARTDEDAKGTTIGKELTTLSMAMKLARKDGVKCELIRDLKPEDFQTTYVPRVRWLQRAEYDRFMKWWYANRQASKGAILDFIVSTGATYPSEVHLAHREDVDVKTFKVRLRGTKRETRDRTFIVPSDRRDLFERALEHGSGKHGLLFESWGNIRRDIRIGCAYVSMCRDCQRSSNLWWFEKQTKTWTQGTSQVVGTPMRDPKCAACKKVELLEPFCPTDLRRTFAQWLVTIAGVPYELAYPLMGHIDDRMLKLVYGKRQATNVAPLIEAVLTAKKPVRHLRAV